MYFSVVLYLLAIVGSPGCWFTSLTVMMSGCLQRMDDCFLLVDCVRSFACRLRCQFFLLHLSYVFFQTLCLNFSFKEFKDLKKLCISSTENICSLCSKARQCTFDFVCFRFLYWFYYYCCCVYIFIFFILLSFLCLNFFLFTF